MSAVLWLIAALQAKHLACDFFLQSSGMVAGKGRYGGLGGLLHVALHGLGTLVVLLLLAPAGLVMVVLIVLAEMVFHYHVDWGKERLSKSRHYTPKDLGYWGLVGTDQALHHWSYLVIAAVAFSAG